MTVSEYETISPTAILTAYLRTFTEIPFSKEIYSFLLDHWPAEEKTEAQLKKLLQPELAPQLEARALLITRLLLESKLTQILEVAAGFSGRGLALTQENPNINYIEFDLPKVIEVKRLILKSINRETNLPNALHTRIGSALNFVDLEAAISNFDNHKPIAIINEGLMRYLTFIEKRVLANNIYKILSKHGGVWITSDISLAKTLQKENSSTGNHTENLSQLSGKNLYANLFENIEKAQEFFTELGFTIEIHSFLEVLDELRSPARINKSHSDVKALIEDAVVFVMKVN